VTRCIRFTLTADNVAAVAELREGAAPRTSQALWDLLPVAGRAHHAVYSGSECVLILPEMVRVPPEVATADVREGDVGFTYFEAGAAHGVTRAFAEVCWFYGEDARPSMHEGPVPVSLFARFLGNSDAFFAACRRMRREGTKAIVIERVAENLVKPAHAVVFRDPYGNAVQPALEADGGGRVRATFTRLGWRPGGAPAWGQAAVSDRLTVRSTDGGATWGGVEVAPTPDKPVDTEGPVRLADGRLLRVYTREAGRGCIAVVAAVSGDGGSSYDTFPIRHLHASDTGEVARPCAVEVVPGRVLCLYVADDGAPDGAPPGGVCAIHATRFALPTGG
jgi:hypothetical protein